MPENNKIGPKIEKSGLNLTKNRRVGEFKVCKYMYHANYFTLNVFRVLAEE